MLDKLLCERSLKLLVVPLIYPQDRQSLTLIVELYKLLFSTSYDFRSLRIQINLSVESQPETQSLSQTFGIESARYK